MKLWRIFISMMVLALAVTCFAACGSGSGSPAASAAPASAAPETPAAETPAEPAEAETPASEAPAAEPEGGSEKTELIYFSWGDEQAYMPAIIDAFNSQSETSFVNVTYIPSDEGTAYEDKMVAMLASNSEMDLFGSSTVKNYIKYRDAGNLSDLTDAINASGLDIERYGASYQSTSQDGKHYGLPYRYTAQVLFYNKKIFDAEGLPYPEQMTWDEYAALAKQLTKTREDGTKQWGGFIPTWYGEPIGAIQHGSSILDPDTTYIKEWLGIMGRLYVEDQSHMSFEEMVSTSTDWLKIFLAGDVALLPNGEWTIGNAQREISENPESIGDFEMGVTYMPLPNGVTEPVTVGGANTYIMINQNTEKFDEAFKFASFLAGPEGVAYLINGGMIPAYIDDETISLYQNTIDVDGVEALLQSETRFESAIVEEFAQIDAIWREEKELYLIGEQTLDESIASFEERRTPLMNP